MKILVVGVARSGTSFLGELFRQNPVVAYLHEPFWGDTFFRRRQMCWLTENDREPEGEKLLREVYDGRFDELQRQQPAPKNPERGFTSRSEELTHHLGGKDFAGNSGFAIKEIRLNMHLRWVRAVLGDDLRIIHLVRDPRGVVASFLLRNDSEPSTLSRFLSGPLSFLKSGEQRQKTMYDEWEWHKAPGARRFSADYEKYVRCLDVGSPWEKIAARWTLATGHALSDSIKIPESHYFRLRYEDLCRDPIRVSKRVYEFLGLAWPKEVEEWLEKNTQSGDRADRYSTSRNSLDMIDAWKAQLNSRQTRDVEAICRPLMETLNYEIA